MILPPSLLDPDTGMLPPGPYIQQMVYMFHPIPESPAASTSSGQALMISVCSMFNQVHAMRCLGCDQEVWQVAGDISERLDLRDKMVEHVGLHMDAGYAQWAQVQ